MKIPSYIKISSKKPQNPWPEENEIALRSLRAIATQIDDDFGCSLYLTGSSTGREAAENVMDLDLLVVVPTKSPLSKVEKFTRRNRIIPDIDVPITYMFFPEKWTEKPLEYLGASFFNLAYYTHTKMNHIHLGGKDYIGSAPWLPKKDVRENALICSLSAVYELFKTVNKERYTEEQNYLVFKYVREIVIRSMQAKFYFGYSKTELYENFPLEYKVENTLAVETLTKSRFKGRTIFTQKNPKKIQQSSLLFAEEMLTKLK